MRSARLWAYCGVLTALIVAPWAAPGYLLVRDMVSTPRSFVTDSALGLTGSAPRAVPQDWFVALLSGVVDGGIVIKVLTAAAILCAGVGFGRLAQRTLPTTGLAGQCVAATVAIWNPFVAERLLQGHWSLLVGYATLGWAARAALDGRRWVLLSLMAVAGLTPTGSLLVLIVALVCGSGRIRTLLMWVVTAAPWMIAAVVGGSAATSDPQAVSAFSARAEPLLGTVGSVAGLGGIWNADAVPASRTGAWALVATVLFLVPVAIGAPQLLRRQRWSLGIVLLATLTPVAIAAAATGPGIAVMEWGVGHVPGFGLLRDSTKFIALMVPGFALAAAASVLWFRSQRWRVMAAITMCCIVIAPLADLGWAVGGRVMPVRYPVGWVTALRDIPPNTGDVLIVPRGSVRHYRFTDGPVLDPVPRMVNADTVIDYSLRVDGRVVDAADERTGRAYADRTPESLARLGIGWVVTETPDSVAVQRISHPTPQPDRPRTLMWIAHLVWLASVVAAPAAALVRAIRRRR